MEGRGRNGRDGEGGKKGEGMGGEKSRRTNVKLLPTPLKHGSKQITIQTHLSTYYIHETSRELSEKTNLQHG